MEEKSKKLEINSKEIAREANGQLKKGVVLNPNGRPKGSESFATKWYRMVEKIADSNNITPDQVEEELLKVGYKRAKDGDYSFYRDAMDRIHGKPLQKTDLTSGGQPLIISFDPSFNENKSDTQ